MVLDLSSCNYYARNGYVKRSGLWLCTVIDTYNSKWLTTAAEVTIIGESNRFINSSRSTDAYMRQ